MESILPVINDYPKIHDEQEEHPLTVDTKEVVTTISYLIGVRKDILELNFVECKDTLDKLYADRDTIFVQAPHRALAALQENGQRYAL